MQHQPEVPGLDDAILGEGVQEVQGVLEPEVEGISGERPLQVGSALIDPSQADLVQSHEAPPGPAVGVGLGGGTRESERVAVLAVVGGELGEDHEGRGG